MLSHAREIVSVSYENSSINAAPSTAQVRGLALSLRPRFVSLNEQDLFSVFLAARKEAARKIET
jgi:hypothetical protein